jgi:hypothetical protein
MNLLEIAKLNNADTTAGLLDEAAKVAPEVSRLFARPVKGVNYKTVVRVGLPTAGFRKANEGVAESNSAYAERLVEAFIMDCQVSIDKAVADAYDQGAPALIAMQQGDSVEAGFLSIGSQLYYGAVADAKGFTGLKANVDSSMIVNAEGNASAACTSVWAVRTGIKDVCLAFGNDGKLDSPAEVQIIQKRDGNGKVYAAYWTYLMGRVGLQLGTKYSFGAVKNVDSSHALDDDMLSDLKAKFPAGRKPDFFMMTPAALNMLRKSRTATNATGAPAPTPTESNNIPIYETDSILNTETAW